MESLQQRVDRWDSVSMSGMNASMIDVVWRELSGLVHELNLQQPSPTREALLGTKSCDEECLCHADFAQTQNRGRFAI